MKKFLSHILIGTGLFCLIVASYLVYLRNFSNPLAFKSAPKPINVKHQYLISTITIPSIRKELPIIPAKITNNKWETTEKGVSLLSSTPTPGEMGNSVMYGHNWKTILGDLYKVKPGEEIIVTLKTGEKRRFIVENTAVIDPSQTYIIENTKDTRLTLYTCTGFLDNKRFVVVAKPKVLSQAR